MSCGIVEKLHPLVSVHLVFQTKVAPPGFHLSKIEGTHIVWSVVDVFVEDLKLECVVFAEYCL